MLKKAMQIKCKEDNADPVRRGMSTRKHVCSMNVYIAKRDIRMPLFPSLMLNFFMVNLKGFLALSHKTIRGVC